jgi:hypothetical protein
MALPSPTISRAASNSVTPFVDPVRLPTSEEQAASRPRRARRRKVADDLTDLNFHFALVAAKHTPVRQRRRAPLTPSCVASTRGPGRLVLPVPDRVNVPSVGRAVAAALVATNAAPVSRAR